MHSIATSKSKPAKRSLTDQILALCASGHFGVREAIAVALKSSAGDKRSQPDGKSEQEIAVRLLQEQAD